jgi:O-antigen/teichoic acid export membrane protein
MGLGALIGTFALVAGMLFGKIVLGLVYRPEYAEKIDVFLFLLLAETFYYVAVALGVGMTASRHFKLQVPLSLVSVMLTVLFSYALIPTFGVVGAALTIVATMATVLAAHLIAFPIVLRSAPLVSVN